MTLERLSEIIDKAKNFGISLQIVKPEDVETEKLNLKANLEDYSIEEIFNMLNKGYKLLYQAEDDLTVLKINRYNEYGNSFIDYIYYVYNLPAPPSIRTLSDKIYFVKSNIFNENVKIKLKRKFTEINENIQISFYFSGEKNIFFEKLDEISFKGSLNNNVETELPEFLVKLYDAARIKATNSASTESSLTKISLKINSKDNSKLWLIQDFLLSNGIITIYAHDKVGKTTLAYLIAIQLLANDKVDRVIYLNNDDPKIKLEQKKVYELINKYNNTNKFLYISKDNINEEIFDLVNEDLEENRDKKTLIIVDSIRMFMFGRNPDIEKDALSYLSQIKTWVKKGATVIQIHHKGKGLSNRAKNSSAYTDYSMSYFDFKENSIKDGVLSFILETQGSKIPIKKEIFGFIVFKNLSITLTDGSCDFGDQYLCSTIFKIISKNPLVSTPDIIKEVKNTTKATESKVREVLKKYNKKLWSENKLGKNNTSLYTISNNEFISMEFSLDNFLSI